MPARHERALEALARRGRLRRLDSRRGRDFSSNDYLGLAASTELAAAARAALDRGVAVGAGGSRLLRGNDPEHEALEAEAAAYFGAQSALFFSGGFAANYALFATLPQRGDLVVHDELIHASAHDGMAAGRAETMAVAHNDAQAFDDAIGAWRARGGTGQPWIAVESLYSMDGDCAPIADLAQIAARHDAMLLIDEAHATGVWGPGGRGLAAHLEGQANVVTLHTCGKALGVAGALVLGPTHLRDFLVNRARAFIYATAPSPLIAALVRASLRLLATEPERRLRLHDLVARTGALLQPIAAIKTTGTQIQPVIVGSDARAVDLASALAAAGFDVRAIRPPTVPEGSSRLRISLTLNVEAADVEQLVATLAPLLEEIAR
jgi:8-amino-7-oxononanoate synthase